MANNFSDYMIIFPSETFKYQYNGAIIHFFLLFLATFLSLKKKKIIIITLFLRKQDFPQEERKRQSFDVSFLFLFREFSFPAEMAISE